MSFELSGQIDLEFSSSSRLKAMLRRYPPKDDQVSISLLCAKTRNVVDSCRGLISLYSGVQGAYQCRS